MQYIKRVSGGRDTRIDLLLDAGHQAHYVVDLSHASKYNVRGKYEKYGATAFFDENKRAIAIWWDAGRELVMPSDLHKWQHTKAIMNSTLVKDPNVVNLSRALEK